MIKEVNRKGQMTIFVIIAIVIVALIVLFFVFKDQIINADGIPSDLEPVFNYYSLCIEQETRAAIELAGTQAGYVDTNDLEYQPGSDYAPFGSELNFLGFPVPYWYYVSGNGVIKEQVPSKRDIESGIEDYIEERLNECDFDNYLAQGFDVSRGVDSVRVIINENNIDVIINGDFVARKEDTSARKERYEISIKSKFGKFYNLARRIYESEKNEAFFEEYAVDVLRLYAPVDGVETGCSGKVWKTREVVEELRNALSANMASLKFEGSYYGLNEDKNKYFEVDVGQNVDENINLIYSTNMPSKIEIYGENVDNDLMMAFPIGVQEGLGIMGFCYSPYHFVYDVSFPVLVQVYDNEEIFQFPIVVVVDNNMPREGIYSELVDEGEEFDLCEFMTQDVEINLYDVNLNRADADISYECFNQRCELGESKNGRFVGNAPSCLNGYLLFRSEEFDRERVLFSSSSQRIIDVFLDRTYDVELDLSVGGRDIGQGTAIISFRSVDGDKVISTSLPEVSEIEISEGSYNVEVYVYDNTGINIPASSKTQCQEIPSSGILGFFGGTKEECFDIDVPETVIDYALVGGGKGTVYLLEEQLESGKLMIDVDSLPLPRSLEDLQYNYAQFELNKARVL